MWLYFRTLTRCSAILAWRRSVLDLDHCWTLSMLQTRALEWLLGCPAVIKRSGTGIVDTLLSVPYGYSIHYTKM
jgi:hypothetical protein